MKSGIIFGILIVAIVAAVTEISTIVLNNSIQIVSAQGLPQGLPPNGNPQVPPNLINP